MKRWWLFLRSWLGYMLNCFFRNNNNYFYLAVVVFIGSTIYLFNYKLGEPILVSGVEEVVGDHLDMIRSAQRVKNAVLYGQKISNNEVEAQKKYFSVLAGKYPIIKKEVWQKVNPSDVGLKQFRQNEMNYLRYGLFTTDDEIIKLRQGMPDSFKKNNTTQDQGNEKKNNAGKSWWPFLFTVIMFFVCIIVAVIVFRDEVADALESLVYHIVERYEEIVNVRMNPRFESNSGDNSGRATSKGLGLFARLYSSDMAAEFTINLLEKIVSFLRR